MGRRRGQELKISLFSFQDIITSVTGIMILITLLLALELVNSNQRSPATQTSRQTESATKTIAELRDEIDAINKRLQAEQQDVASLPSFSLAVLSQMWVDVSDDANRLEGELASLQEQFRVKGSEATQKQVQTKNDQLATDQKIEDVKQQIADVQQQITDVEGSNRVYYSSGITGKTIWIVEVTASTISAAQIGVQSAPSLFSTLSQFEQWTASLNSGSDALFLLIKPGGASQFRSIKDAIYGNFEFGYQVVATNQQILDPKIGAGKP